MFLSMNVFHILYEFHLLTHITRNVQPRCNGGQLYMSTYTYALVYIIILNRYNIVYIYFI